MLRAIMPLFGLLALSFQAKAEYRIYKLNLVDQKGEVVKEVMSTLDHMQYSSYFHVPDGVNVVYLDSWKCYGHTGNFKTYCQDPDKNAGRLPSSLPTE